MKEPEEDFSEMKCWRVDYMNQGRQTETVFGDSSEQTASRFTVYDSDGDVKCSYSNTNHVERVKVR